VSWITDPDGYRIELVQWPAGHADGITEADFAVPGSGTEAAGAETEEMTGTTPAPTVQVISSKPSQQESSVVKIN
jgi:hypothetical protein